MIILEGIELPDVVEEEEISWSGVAAAVERTIQGKLIVTEQAIDGRPITLIGGDDWGWITREVLNELKSLASQPYAIYTLQYDFSAIRYPELVPDKWPERIELISVRFRHEEEPVINATPLVQRPNWALTDYYNNVTIKLMEV